MVPVDDIEGGYDYPSEVRFQIAEQDFDSYLRAADFLNFSNADVVCLQHEFGIYGGASGSHVLGLLRDLRMPVVTTLHTVLREPNAEQRRIIEQLADVSARLIVMSEKGKAMLQEVYGIAESKIALIAHGIPDMPFVDPIFFKDKFGVEGQASRADLWTARAEQGHRARAACDSAVSCRISPTSSTSCSGPRIRIWSVPKAKPIA